MNAAHHLDRSRLYPGFVTRNVLAGEYDRAARAVHRAAAHAVTAAAVHWHQRHGSWRRLTTVLGMLVRDGLLGYRHLRTFREVLRLPCLLAQASGDIAALRGCCAVFAGAWTACAARSFGLCTRTPTP